MNMNILNIGDIINIVRYMAEIIIDNEKYFNQLDSFTGDGDCGSSLGKGFKVIIEKWGGIPKTNIGAFLRGCGMMITENCGGASGPIWGAAFMNASRYAKEKTELNLNEISEMMQCAVDGIQKIGKAGLGDKTLLDALIPSVKSLEQSCELKDDIPLAMKKSAAAAVAGAEKTKELVAMKGRASYLGERSLGHPDAGATAVGVIFTGVSKKFMKD